MITSLRGRESFHSRIYHFRSRDGSTFSIHDGPAYSSGTGRFVDLESSRLIPLDAVQYHPAVSRDCHHRIRYRKTCPVHGEVSSEEIVSGYEYAQGQSVVVESEELDRFANRKRPGDRDRRLRRSRGPRRGVPRRQDVLPIA